MLSAHSIPIAWYPDLSIYASEAFLKSVGNEYGWLGGFDENGKLRCVLPYTIVRKPFLRMVRFRVETIPVDGILEIEEEKQFLNSVIRYVRKCKADLVIPATTNTIFRTYPDQAVAAPYGSYVVDLRQSENTLWDNLHSKHRNVIRNAKHKGVTICEGREYAQIARQLICETLGRSKLGFLGQDEFDRALTALGPNVKLFVAKHEGIVQGCAVIPFSNHSAYYLYGGNAAQPLTGAMNLLQWEAMLYFRSLGVVRYDFVGVRINPAPGSKQEGLQKFKQRFGGQLVSGYIWKCAIHPLKYRLYCLAAHWRSGGDIVDKERHKLMDASLRAVGKVGNSTQ